MTRRLEDTMRALSRNCVGAMMLGLFVVWSACTAGDLPSAKIKVGEKMADFTLPESGGGKAHSLYEIKGKQAVAVIFIATQCPYSNAFNQLMAKLVR